MKRSRDQIWTTIGRAPKDPAIQNADFTVNMFGGNPSKVLVGFAICTRFGMISWKCIVSSFTLRCNQLQSLQQRSSFGLLQPFSFSSLLVSKWCSTHAQAGSALPWLPAQSRNTGSKLAAGCSLLKGLIFLHMQGRFNSIALNGIIPCLSQTPHSRHITAWLYFSFQETHLFVPWGDPWPVASSFAKQPQPVSQSVSHRTSSGPLRLPASSIMAASRGSTRELASAAKCMMSAPSTKYQWSEPQSKSTNNQNQSEVWWILNSEPPGKPCQARSSSFSHPAHLCRACWAWHTSLAGYYSLQP